MSVSCRLSIIVPFYLRSRNEQNISLWRGSDQNKTKQNKKTHRLKLKDLKEQIHVACSIILTSSELKILGRYCNCSVLPVSHSLLTSVAVPTFSSTCALSFGSTWRQAPHFWWQARKSWVTVTFIPSSLSFTLPGHREQVFQLSLLPLYCKCSALTGKNYVCPCSFLGKTPAVDARIKTDRQRRIE